MAMKIIIAIEYFDGKPNTTIDTYKGSNALFSMQIRCEIDVTIDASDQSDS